MTHHPPPTEETAADLIESILRGNENSVNQMNMESAIDTLLEALGIDDVDDPSLVERVGFISDGCSLLNLTSSRAGAYLMHTDSAKMLIQCLLDKGAGIQVNSSGCSPLGMMVDAAMKAEYSKYDLFDVAQLLIDKGDYGAGSVDVFIEEIGEMKGRQAALDFLGRSLSIVGQKKTGAYLKSRIASEMAADDIAKHTPLVQHAPGIRRF